MRGNSIKFFEDYKTVSSITKLAREYQLKLISMSDSERVEFVKRTLLTTKLHTNKGKGVHIEFKYMKKNLSDNVIIDVGFQWHDCGQGDITPVVGYDLTNCDDEGVTPIMRLTFKTNSFDVDDVIDTNREAFHNIEEKLNPDDDTKDRNHEFDNILSGYQDDLDMYLIGVDVLGLIYNEIDGYELIIITDHNSVVNNIRYHNIRPMDYDFDDFIKGDITMDEALNYVFDEVDRIDAEVEPYQY